MNRPALEALRTQTQTQMDEIRPRTNEAGYLPSFTSEELYFAARWWALAEQRAVLDALLAPAPPNPLDRAEVAALEAFTSKHFATDGMVERPARAMVATWVARDAWLAAARNWSA